METVQSVLSLNEQWEREPFGLSLPYTQEDWQELGIHFETVEVEDHTLVDSGVLNAATDFIHAQIEQNKNVLVHCRAGKGRSA